MGIFLAEVFHQTFITEDVQMLFAACHYRTEWASTCVLSSVYFLGDYSLEKIYYSSPTNGGELCKLLTGREFPNLELARLLNSKAEKLSGFAWNN